MPLYTYSQDGSQDPIECHVDKIYNDISLYADELEKVSTIQDINKFFKNEWVREYISVQYKIINKGIEKTINTNTGEISKDLKYFLQSADNGTDISVHIDYIPENSLKHNEPKEDEFTFVINPEKLAAFPGGTDKLEAYLNEQVLIHVSKDVLPGYSLAAVKFTVTNEGNIQNIQIIESSNDEKTDVLLLEAVNNMPVWIPAEYTDGSKVQQECMLTVGNMKSCTINLLNIKRYNFDMQ